MVDLSNAFTGAGTGAGLGAAFGPLGAGIGGLLGGIGGLFGAGKSKKPKIKQLPLFDQQQQSLIDELVEGARSGNQNALQYLNSILSEEPGAFEAFEKPAMEQFETQIAPSILEKLNVGDNKYRSGVTNALAQAGRGLSTDLAAQRARIKQQAIADLLAYGGQGLTRKTQPYIQGGKKGAFEMLAPAAGQGFGELMNMLQSRYGV